MTIPDKDIQLLWGKAGGRCAFTDCRCLLFPFLQRSKPIHIGEMAHIIARSSRGPRGGARLGGGTDTYENLVLLCPTHHRLVDKAPDDFSPEDLLAMKAEHESWVDRRLSAPHLDTRLELFAFIHKLLAENEVIHTEFGPDSAIARANPLTDAADIWSLRKLDTIIPNNSRIVQAIDDAHALLDVEEFRLAALFKQHAAVFAQSAESRVDHDAAPRFPPGFAVMVARAVRDDGVENR